MTLTAVEALRAYARMLNCGDVQPLAHLLSDNFTYTSQSVLAELTSRDAFLAYMAGKLVAASSAHMPLYAEMGNWPPSGNEPCVVIAQGDKENLLCVALATVDAGKLTRLDLCQIPPPSEAIRTGEYP